MPVPFLNPATQQLEYYAEQDLTPQNLQALAGRGLRQATPEDVANRERTIQYSTVAQQSLAQAERIVRGGTLGLVEGIAGTEEEQRARAEVSQEVSPVLSLAADLAPDVALGVLTGGGSALATTGGRIAAREAGAAGLRAALGAASKAAPVAALAGEAVAGGLVTASQQAYQEGRSAWRDDPVQDATNALFWAGIGGVLGGAPMAFRAARGGAGKVAREAAEAADEVELDAAFRAGEESVPNGVPVPEQAGADSFGIPHTTDEGTLEAAARASATDVADSLSPGARDALLRSRERQAAAGSVTVGEAPREIPLDDVQMLDKEGYLEPASPRKLKKHADDIRRSAETAISGKSLDDLRALPIEGPGAEQSAAKIKAFAEDKGFRETGLLPSNNDRGRGGLPAFGIEADGSVYLSNGRHRLTAARQTGQEYIVANLKKYDKKGNPVWDYVGPVRVNPAPKAGAGVRGGERGMGPVDYLKEKLGGSSGSTEGGMYRGSDGRERYVKFMRPDDAFNEASTARAYQDFGIDHMQHTTADGGPEGHMVLSDKLGPEWQPLGSYKGPVTSDMAQQYLQGVPADIVLGNVDRALNPGNVMTDGKRIVRIDAGTAGPYVLGAPVMRHQVGVKGMWDELLDPVMSGEASGGLADGPRALATEGGVKSLKAAEASLRDGVARIEASLSSGGGAKRFVADRYPHLSATEQAEFAKQIEQRLKAVKANVNRIARDMAESGFIVLDARGPNFTLGGLAASPMGNVTAAGAGALVGGQVDGRDGAMAGAGLGFFGSLLLGRRGGKAARGLMSHAAERGAVDLGSKETARAARQAERGVAKAERNAVRSQAEDIVDRVAKGESPLKESGGFARSSRLAQYQPEIIETATKEMRNDLNELNNLSQGIRERAVKHEDVAKNITDNLPAQQSLARDAALAGQRLAGSIMADARARALQMGKKRPQHFSKTSMNLVSSLINHTKAIAKMKDGAEIFNAMDDLKRVVDKFKTALEQGSRGSSSDPLAYRDLVPRVQDYVDHLRASLEDVSTFGRAGEMQKAYNATYHQKWYPAKRVFEESVFKVTGRDYRAFDTLDAWEGKITALLKESGSGERRHVGDMLAALREMAEQRAKYGTASKAETGRIIELVDKINRTFGLADETMAAVRQMQNMTNAASIGAAAAGAVLGGIPGAVVSGGIARGAAELATGKYRRAFMAMRGATDDAVNKSVDDWINISKVRSAANDTGRRKRLMPQLSPEDRALLKSARRLGTTFGVAQFLEDNDDPQAAFAQKRLALQDDVGFMKRFAEEFSDLATEEPDVYMVAAGKAGEVRKFLVDRLPANIAVSMARPNGYPPTNEAVEDWSVYWNAATNPRTAVASLARGDIRPQEIETLRTLYRPMYESLQASLIDRISRATELGDDLDDQFVMRMSLLFDLDGAGTPAFSNRAAAVARSVQPQQTLQNSKPFAPKAGSRVSPSNVAVTGPTYGTAG